MLSWLSRFFSGKNGSASGTRHKPFTMSVGHDLKADRPGTEFSKSERRKIIKEAVRISREKSIKEEMEKRRAKLITIIATARNKSINKYGDLDESFIKHEAEEFLRVCLPNIPPDEDTIYFAQRELQKLLNGISDKSEAPVDPIEFEYWCAKEIERLGWNCTVTTASGDQGVDIIASYGEKVVAIQCKRFSKPVGNSCVQEVFAAATFVGATDYCVIATCGFTRSATELAQSTGTKLIEASAISQFNELFL